MTSWSDLLVDEGTLATGSLDAPLLLSILYCLKLLNFFIQTTECRFCKTFSAIALPLTTLFSKKVKFMWSKHCEETFR